MVGFVLRGEGVCIVHVSIILDASWGHRIKRQNNNRKKLKMGGRLLFYHLVLYSNLLTN